MPPNRKTPRKSPQKSHRRRNSTLPLDPSLTQQRELFSQIQGGIPVATLKSTTRHPTVFRKRIADVQSSTKHGDIVCVRSDSGETIGYGVWICAELTVRILSWGKQLPDDAWWNRTLDDAVRVRTDVLNLDSDTDAYRVIHAEGDGVPGLVADRYGDVLSIEVFSLGMFQRSRAIAELLSKKLSTPHWVVRTGPMTFEQEGFLADGLQSGRVPDRLNIQEHGVRFEVHPFQGHKTGFFCDQRDNRKLLRQFCKGKRVLDLCCYTGGFAMNAALAGAASVTGVDLDEDAIALAKRNANLNRASVKFVHADAFAYLRDLQRNGSQFDVVILDPPKLIRGRGEISDGKKKYYDLNQLAGNVVTPGGVLVTCSCSGLLSMTDFTYTVRSALSASRPRILLRTGAAPDHPIASNCLETEYLKCLWMQIPGN